MASGSAEFNQTSVRFGMKHYVEDDNQWATLLATLCTVTGSAGGALELQFSRINENLKEIKQLSQTTPQPSRSLLKRLDTIQEGVKMAAEVLGNENGFACQCQSSHTAFLRIKDCFDTFQGDYACQGLGSTCSLVFNNTSHLESSQWNWVEFGLDNPAELDSVQPSALPVVLNTPRTTGGFSSIKSALKLVQRVTPRKRVGWGERPSSSHSSLTIKKTGRVKKPFSNSNDTTLGSFSTEPRIGLCNFISLWCDPSKVSISGEDTESHQSGFTIARDDMNLKMTVDRKASESAVFWTEVLSIRNQYTNVESSGLSTEHKLELAHRVGFSLLYLRSTTWLRESWDGDDFFFPQPNDGNAFPESVLLKKKIHNDFFLGASRDEDDSAPSLITCFGRFLLELCCGSSWKSIRKTILNSSSPDGFSDQDDYIFTTFLSWVEDPTVATSDKPCFQEGRSYFEAIRNCFSTSLVYDVKEASITDKDFRTWIWEYVLLPLRFALEDYRKKQSQLFWPPLNGSPKTVEPATALGDRNPPRLFDDETIQGDSATVKKK
jgi:hypothetical protein